MDALLDWTFVIGAGAAIVLAPLSVLAVRWSRPPRRVAVLVTGLGVAVGIAFISHWVVWSLAFDYVHGEPVPNNLFPVTTGLMSASAVGCVLLLGFAAATVTRAVTRRAGQAAPL